MSKISPKFFQRLRLAIQIFFVVLVIGGASSRNLEIPLVSTAIPELQGLCPFGAIQTITRLFTRPESILRPDRSSLWVLGGIILLTLLFGPIFCSHMCPLGSIQEWLGKLGKKFFKRRYNTLLSVKLVKILSILRYAVLVFVLLVGLGLIGFSLDWINPAFSLAHLWTTIVPLSAVLILLAVAFFSLIIERPWCKFFCPLGALQSLLGRISLFKIRRNPTLCRKCGRCDKVCPMASCVSQSQQVDDLHCNRCLKCIATCPVPQALEFRIRSK